MQRTITIIAVVSGHVEMEEEEEEKKKVQLDYNDTVGDRQHGPKRKEEIPDSSHRQYT